MKKNIFTFSLLIAGFLGANAQTSMTLVDTATHAMAQPSYTVSVVASGGDSRLFYIKNNLSTPLSVQGTSTVVANPGSDIIQYCIGGQCHNAGQTMPATIIPGNGTLTTNGLLLDFTDFGGVGKDAAVSYNIFNSSNPHDAVTISILYHIVAATGIKQNTVDYNISNAAPNPASSSISITHDLKNTQGATLKIYNMLGTLVKTNSLESYNTSTKIDVSSLEEGIYFYSVNIDGKPIKTSRLIIAR
ncbi:MAG: T9SS type A sorting domain-containing protein [Bacteroidetes bacterium]|nr:T9SS type A sorting domain-containing protein [Bacteroidota bacterium]